MCKIVSLIRKTLKTSLRLRNLIPLVFLTNSIPSCNRLRKEQQQKEKKN